MNWAPLLGHDQLDRKNPITKYIPQMIFLQNGSIDISGAKENKDAKATVLASSSDKSWTVSENIILYPGYIFPPEDREKIFDRFFTADRAHTAGKGTGLGLSICRRILEMHGQSIRLLDTEEGAAFRFTLQAAEKKPSAS